MEARIRNDILTSLDETTLDSINNDETTRKLVISAAYRMLARIQTPFEQMWRFTLTSNTSAALQTLIDLGLWERWRSSGGDEATLEYLHSLCRVPCDINLLRRLLRVMSAAHILEETGRERYKPTPTSLALGDPASPVALTAIAGGSRFAASAMNLPQFLAKTQYQEPLDPSNTNFMELTPERLNIFTLLKTDPKSQAAFVGAMRGLSERRRSWTELYDTQRLFDGYDSETTLLVDIGGGHGREITSLAKKHEDRILPGSLVLQDVPDVVSIINLNDKIKAMPYDFFTPQPIKGARSYFMKSVLHDWNDSDAKKILQQVRTAMKKDYSKLLIGDVVVPTTGADIDQAAADITLMHLHSAKERTEDDWRKLLEDAGFDIIKIWKGVGMFECVIEAQLASEREQ